MDEKIKDGDKSLAKLFEIIEAVAETRSGMKGRDIAEKNGYPLFTAEQKAEANLSQHFWRFWSFVRQTA